jgi:hypothetical protein
MGNLGQTRFNMPVNLGFILLCGDSQLNFQLPYLCVQPLPLGIGVLLICVFFKRRTSVLQNLLLPFRDLYRMNLEAFCQRC